MQTMAAGIGLSLVPGYAQSAIKTAGSPKRIIFFLQNHGFDPLTCIPKGLNESCALDGVTHAGLGALQGQDAYHQRPAWPSYQPLT